MKTVTATIKLVFETEDSGNDSLMEGLYNALEEKVEEGDIMDSTKLKIVDNEEDDESYEDDED